MLSSPPPPSDPVVAGARPGEYRSQRRFDSRRISLRATLFEDLARITAPVQIIWGASDKLAFPSVQSRVESCQNVRADLGIVVVPNGV